LWCGLIGSISFFLFVFFLAWTWNLLSKGANNSLSSLKLDTLNSLVLLTGSRGHLALSLSHDPLGLHHATSEHRIATK
jgi:hypothetical protein